MLMASSHALVRKNRSRDSFLLVWTGRLVLLVSSVVNTASPMNAVIRATPKSHLKSCRM